MERLYSIFRYIGYLVVAILIGWISFLGGEDGDYIQQISGSIIPVLLTLVVLNITLTTSAINELIKTKSDNIDLNLNPAIDSLRRNVLIEISILTVAFLFLSCKGFLILKFPHLASLLNVASNSIIAFALLYFGLVILDTTMGLYTLIKNNSK